MKISELLENVSDFGAFKQKKEQELRQQQQQQRDVDHEDAHEDNLLVDLASRVTNANKGLDDDGTTPIRNRQTYKVWELHGTTQAGANGLDYDEEQTFVAKDQDTLQAIAQQKRLSDVGINQARVELTTGQRKMLDRDGYVDTTPMPGEYD